MTTNIERANLVSRCVEIESVVLTDTTMRATVPSLEEPTDFRMGQWFRCRYELNPSHPDHLFVHVELRLDANPVRDTVPDPTVVDLTATFLATYRLMSAASFPLDALQHFADLNGTYNVWPYWRELVQSFAGRAGLPGIVVPVFKPKVREILTQEQLPLPIEPTLPALSPSGSTAPDPTRA